MPHRVHVLLVEDTRPAGMALRDMLEHIGCRVTWVRSLAGARMLAEPPHVAFVDLGLGGEDGGDLVAELTCPIVIISGSAAPDGLASRVHAALMKPATMAELAGVLEQLGLLGER